MIDNNLPPMYTLTAEEFTQKVADGVIDSKGAPLKCDVCGSTQLQSQDWYENYVRVETSVTCTDCGRNVGYWSYGSWML